MFAAKQKKPLPLSQVSAPAHIAILSNGSGDQANIEDLDRLLRTAVDTGVKYLTLFRPGLDAHAEASGGEGQRLADLLAMQVCNNMTALLEKNISLKIIGNRDEISHDTRVLLESIEKLTVGNTGLKLIIALAYQGRGEILRAIQRVAAQVESGALNSADVNEEVLEANLETAGIPDPDIIIYTGGKSCNRNFLIWQSAYSEFIFVDTFWCDFTGQHLFAAITEFQGRSRRFGGLSVKSHP